MNHLELIQAFTDYYGPATGEIRLYFAPGRVNIIGEHTDYNQGYVLPCALSYGTYLAIRQVGEPVLHFCSKGFDFTAKVPVQDRYASSGKNWINYPLGVLDTFAEMGFKPGGLQMLYFGDIPSSAGLSSSASIEMVTAFALNDIYNWKFEIAALIKLCRKAENEFVGVNCGIMDQFAVGSGKKLHAIFLHCGTLEYEHVPLNIPGYRLVVINTNKVRSLNDSKYNERVEECAKALEYLPKELEISSLGELGEKAFTENQHLIRDEMILRRARHVVKENKRVQQAVESLRKGDFERFGKLLFESHESLKNDYEVTGIELDSLVDLSKKHKGVLGARMTGAGFGGCAIAFVRTLMVEEFISHVSEAYFQATGLNAEFYLPEIGNGARKL